MNDIIFIPHAVPSSKNSRFMTKSGLFIASQSTQKYRKLTAPYWLKYKTEFKKIMENKKLPVILGMHFVRGSKHNWDFINPAQTIQDEMTKAGWIEDDNANIILTVPLNINGKYWSYDKAKPGVYIAILNSMCDNKIILDYETNKNE